MKRTLSVLAVAALGVATHAAVVSAASASSAEPTVACGDHDQPASPAPDQTAPKPAPKPTPKPAPKPAT